MDNNGSSLLDLWAESLWVLDWLQVHDSFVHDTENQH